MFIIEGFPKNTALIQNLQILKTSKNIFGKHCLCEAKNFLAS